MGSQLIIACLHGLFCFLMARYIRCVSTPLALRRNHVLVFTSIQHFCDILLLYSLEVACASVGTVGVSTSWCTDFQHWSLLSFGAMLPRFLLDSSSPQSPQN